MRKLRLSLLILVIFYPADYVLSADLNNDCSDNVYSDIILSVLAPNDSWAERILPSFLCIDKKMHPVAFYYEKPGNYQKKVRQALIGNTNFYDLVILDSYALREVPYEFLRIKEFNGLERYNIFEEALYQARHKSNKSRYLALPVAIDMPLQVSKPEVESTLLWSDLIQQLSIEKKEKLAAKNGVGINPDKTQDKTADIVSASDKTRDNKVDIGSLAFPLIKGHSSIKTLRGLSSGFSGGLGDKNGRPNYLSLKPAIEALHKLYKLSWPQSKSSTGKDAIHTLKKGIVKRAWATQSDIYTVLHHKQIDSSWKYSSLPIKVSANNKRNTISAYDVWLIAVPKTSRINTSMIPDLIKIMQNHSSELSKAMLPAIMKDSKNISPMAQSALISLKNNSKAPSIAPNFRQVLRIVLGVQMEKIIDNESKLVQLLNKAQKLALDRYNK